MGGGTCWAVSPSKRLFQLSALQRFGRPGCGWLQMRPVGTIETHNCHQGTYKRAPAQSQHAAFNSTTFLTVHAIKILNKALTKKKKGHQLQGKQIWQTLKAWHCCVVRSSVILTTTQRPTAGKDKQSDYSFMMLSEWWWVWNMLFLHKFPYYLEKVRPVSSVLDNDSVLNNSHIHEADRP